VQCPKGGSKFWGIATTKKPKLYVVTVDERPIYVGVTKQPIRNRLRFGWSAKGAHGYYGYRWRHHFEKASLDVWTHDDPPDDLPLRDIETVEAEVVFLIRSTGQWPLYQTEIHFHASSIIHRHAAAVIASGYDLHLPDQS
jgi:hypothetical protein